MIYLIEENPKHPGAAHARVAGGPFVWELVAHWRQHNRNIHKVAEHFGLPLETVRIVLWYYAANYKDINDRIRQSAAQAEAITELSAIAQEMGMYE